MNKFEILLNEIKECNIRTQSQETTKILNYLEEFANGLGGDWINVSEQLPGHQEKVIVANQHTNDVYTGQIMARKGYIGWISVDDELPKPEENYYEYDFEPKKFYLVQLKDGYIDTVSFLIDEEHHPYFESCSLYNKDGSYRVQERGFTEYNVSEVKYWRVFPQQPKE